MYLRIKFEALLITPYYVMLQSTSEGSTDGEMTHETGWRHNPCNKVRRNKVQRDGLIREVMHVQHVTQSSGSFLFKEWQTP